MDTDLGETVSPVEDHPIFAWLKELQGTGEDELVFPTDDDVRISKTPLTPKIEPLSTSQRAVDLSSPDSAFTPISIFDKSSSHDSSDSASSIAPESPRRSIQPPQRKEALYRHTQSRDLKVKNASELRRFNPSTLPPLPIGRNMLVWITSCLQCVLKGLPCDKKVPHCTRCTRRGEDGHCLLQFVPYMDSWATPMLLRLGAEGETVGREKMEQQGRLLQSHQTRLDFLNWVLPNPLLSTCCKIPIMHTLQGRMIRNHRRAVHPGRGEGKEKCVTLFLASDAAREARRVYSWEPEEGEGVSV